MPVEKLTMGQLRARLYKAIDDVATGDLDPNRANAIAKLAAQMNQTLMTEVEIARLNILRKIDGHEIGELPLGEIDGQETKQLPAVIEASPIAKRTTAQVAMSRRDVTSALMGDPPAHRSALNQTGEK